MRPDIFGLFQPQSNAQANTALHTSQQQDDSGVRAGIFDALMTEYTAHNDSPPQEIPHLENISQTITTFRNGASFSAPLMNIVATSENEQMLPENVNDNNSGWMNIFAQSRRANVQRCGENAMPESDFDAGVVEVVPDDDDSQPAVNPSMNEPESMSREILPDMAGKKPETLNESASPAMNEPVMIESDSPEYIPADGMNDTRAIITGNNAKDIRSNITVNDEPEISRAMHKPDSLPKISQPAHSHEILPEISQPVRNTETPSAQPTITPQIMQAVNAPEKSLSDKTANTAQPTKNLIAHITENDEPIMQGSLSQPENDTPEYHATITHNEYMPEPDALMPERKTAPKISQVIYTPETLPEISQPMHDTENPTLTPRITPEIMKAVDILDEALNDDTADITQPVLNLVALLTAGNETPITQDNAPMPEILPEISQPIRNTETPPAMPTITPEIMKAADVLTEALNNDEAEITQPALNLVALLTANNDAPIMQDNAPKPDSDTPEYVPVNDGMNDTRATIARDNMQDIRPHITVNNEPEISQAMYTPDTLQENTQAIHVPEKLQEIPQPTYTPETLPEIQQDTPAPETLPEISQPMRNLQTPPAMPRITPEIMKAVDILTEALSDDSADITQPAQNLLSLLNAYTAENDAPITPEDSPAPENNAPKYIPVIDAEQSKQEYQATITPDDSMPVTPRKIPHTSHEIDTQPAIPRMTPEITQAVNVLVEAINDGNTDIRQPAQELVSLITAQKDSPVSIDSPAPEIMPTVNPVEAPRANHEAITPADDDSPEITHNPMNMAGVAGVQVVAQESQAPAQNDSGLQESHTQSRERPRISRNESPRMTRESHSGIAEADSDSHEDSAPVTFTRNEARQDSRNDTSAGHEGRQDSQSQDLSAQVPSRNAQSNNATTQSTRHEAPRPANDRNTTARTLSEAHNDFASFFEGAIRIRRTASRTPAQPLSLRTTEYTPTRSGIVREGIINTVRFIRADGVRKANIIIDPPALGRISVELVSSSSGVEASVKVASEQIRQIVQEQITQLRDNLSQQGVQVSEFTVDVQQDSTGQGQNSGHEDRRSPYSFTAPENDDDAEEFRIDLEEGLLYWVA